MANDMIYGKMPPQAIELETAILGACMLEKNAYEKISAILRPESFYRTEHQLVFAAFARISERHSPIDILTVAAELRKTGQLEAVGGPMAITKLTNGVVSSAHIEEHTKIVYQTFVKRELIRIAGDTLNSAYDETKDAFDVQESAEQGLSLLRMGNSGETVKHFSSYSSQSLKVIEEKRKQETGVTGVPSGIPALDAVTCGFQPTDFIIIAAGPGTGKSVLAKKIAVGAARHFEKIKTGQGALVFSLEMSGIQIANRMLSTESNVWMKRFKSAKVDDAAMEQLYLAHNRLSPLNIYIDETPALSISKFAARCRMAHKKHNIGIIILDYLQLATGPEKNREQEVGNVGRVCKMVAKELGVPLIGLSQLNREGEKRSEPQLFDLRESGALGQHADDVHFLWSHSDEEKKQNPSLENIRYYKIAKSRNGTLEYFAFRFDGAVQEFRDFVLTNRDGSLKLTEDNTQPGLPAGNWGPVEGGARLFIDKD